MRVVRDLTDATGTTFPDRAFGRRAPSPRNEPGSRRHVQPRVPHEGAHERRQQQADEAPAVTNERIAELLEHVAERLAEQRANRFRIDAYRAGARVVSKYPASMQQLALAEGHHGLERLSCIGKSLAACIEEIARTGRLRLLERLDGHAAPEDVLTLVPGIGEKLARRIHDELHVETLPALLSAAHDGRLAALPGFGPRRTAAVRAILKSMLARPQERATSVRANGPEAEHVEWPGVQTLLDVDRRYRELARSDALPRIAPTRNNPDHESWLPILHIDVDGWHFTALFSNSDRAHELRKTDDWVVIHYERHGHESQSTVVTEVTGRLSGWRVVRGQEATCAQLDYERLVNGEPGA